MTVQQRNFKGQFGRPKGPGEYNMKYKNVK